MTSSILLKGILLFLLQICMYCNSEQICEGNLLQDGKFYLYKYHAVAEGAAVGTSDHLTKMDIQCDIGLEHVQHNSDCVFSMQIFRCKLSALESSPDDENYWIKDQDLSILKEYHVLFMIKSGKIGSIITHPKDPLFSVNVKRGIISAFAISKAAVKTGEQNDRHSDVHGICPWKVKPNGLDEATSTKDMLHCSIPSRNNWHLSPYSIFWNMSFIQYLINSSTVCNYRTENYQHLTNVNCHERHAIMLESTHQTTAAVQTNIRYELKLKSFGNLMDHVFMQPDWTRTLGIHFEYDADEIPFSSPHDFTEKAKKMLLDLVITSEDEIRLFSITLFHEFVAWLRAGNDILPFVDSVSTCNFFSDGRLCSDWMKDQGLSYTVDALVQCNTLPCMKAFTYLATNNHVPESYLNFALYSFTNMHGFDPEYISDILSICQETKLRTCWLALGSVINKCSNEHHGFRHSLPEGVQETVGYVSQYIGKNCNINEARLASDIDSSKKTDYMLLMLKTVGNIGEVAKRINEELTQSLYACSQNKELPSLLKVAAIEAMQKMESDDNMYQLLIDILKNQLELVELRLAAYNVLAGHFDHKEFVSELVNLLKIEVSSQVKGYIASHLQQVLVAAESYENFKLYQNLENILKSMEFDLHSIKVDTSVTSHRTLRRAHGLFWDSDLIFNTLSTIPETLRSNLSVNIFDKLYNIMEVGFKSGGWDQVIVRSVAALSGVQQPNTLQYLALIIQQIAGKPSRKHVVQPVLFDKKMEDKINKLHELYQESHQTLRPYLTAYVKMFGNELDFTTLDDMLAALRKKLQQATSAQKPQKLKTDLVSNSTHVLRFIEAYHQFPTLMGLPLNWTTNATLAFSCRAGFKFDIEGKYIQEQIFKSKMFLHPSAALTFVNRMVLDFPTITQIGIQANSSAYSSTQWELHIQRPPSGLVSFSMKVPHGIQKPLQLFRTNQFIKHNKYEDIPDWDVSRVSENWCLQQKFVKDTGLKVCIDTSYVNVTHLIKPWFLMCGWAKWSLTAENTDKDLQAYNMDVSFKRIDKENKELMIKLHGPGSSLKREVPILFRVNTQTGDMSLDIRHSDDPDFEFVFSKTSIKDGVYRIAVNTKHQGKNYNLAYSKENRKEMREPADKNKTPTGRMAEATVNERDLHFETAYNSYHYKSKVHLHDGNIKASVLLTYQNKDANQNWPKKILPSVFWENDKKASLELRANWRARHSRGKDGSVRQTTTHLVVPFSIVELSTHSSRRFLHKLLHVNFTNTERASKQLLSFVNFTYSSQNNENLSSAHEVRVYNLTIPLNSWAFEVLRKKNENDRSYVITLRRSRMVSKEPSNNMFIGWWHPSISNNFDLKEWKSLLEVNLHSENSGHLSKDLRKEISENDKIEYKRTVNADFKLLYPQDGKDESVSFNGSFIWFDTKTLNSFQKDFRMSSSALNLQLDSHSATMWDVHSQIVVVHESFLTNTKNGSPEGTYRLGIRTRYDSNCASSQWDIRHNITAHWLVFSSNITKQCKPGSVDAYLIEINNLVQVPKWHLLDSQLHQLYDSDVPGGESMNFTSGIMDINVIGKWSKSDFEKNAVFKSKLNIFPHSEWRLRFGEDRLCALDIKSANGPLKHISVLSEVDSQWKIFRGTVNVTEQDSTVEDQVLSTTLKLLGPNDMILSLNQSAKYNPTVGKWLRKTVQNALHRLRKIAFDPKHAVNYYLQPETTLGSSFERIKEEVKENALEVEQDALQCLQTFSSLYQPSLELFNNIKTQILDLAQKADHHFRQTIPGWAFYYFDAPQQIKHFAEHNSWQKVDKNITVYIHHPFYWPKLNEKPFLSKSTWMGHLLKDAPIGQEKFAMIYGVSDVLTFDGHMYVYPSYPENSCAYLLAHDVRGKTFSAITTASTQYLLFPGAAITLDGSGEVYINASKTPEPLPFKSYNRKITVVREGNEIVVNSPGFTAICDMNQYCIYKIGTLFHAGTIGLLGNADGESYNDFMAPDGRLLPNAAILGQTYDVSGRISCQLLENPFPAAQTSEGLQKCTKYMQDAITCGNKVSFTMQTAVDACQSVERNEVEMCNMANSFVKYCSRHEMQTQLKEYCSKCEIPDDKKKLSDNSWQEKASFLLKVVLIVDQHSTMFTGGTKGIESFVSELDENFKSNSFSTVLYSLVGFGGNGIHSSPSVHTLNSKLWFESNSIPELLITLRFEGQERGDGLKALQFATTLPNDPTFPAGHATVYVLLTGDDKIWHKPQTIYKLQELLDDTGVTLYTVASYPNLEKGKKVFGVRADGFIFPQRGGAAYLDFPTTPYAKLTSATRGSVFLRKFFEENQNPFFFSEFAEEIGAKVRTETQKCRRCRCLPSGIACKSAECQ